MDSFLIVFLLAGGASQVDLWLSMRLTCLVLHSREAFSRRFRIVVFPLGLGLFSFHVVVRVRWFVELCRLGLVFEAGRGVFGGGLDALSPCGCGRVLDADSWYS